MKQYGMSSLPGMNRFLSCPIINYFLFDEFSVFYEGPGSGRGEPVHAVKSKLFLVIWIFLQYFLIRSSLRSPSVLRQRRWRYSTPVGNQRKTPICNELSRFSKCVQLLSQSIFNFDIVIQNLYLILFFLLVLMKGCHDALRLKCCYGDVLPEILLSF